MVGPMARPEPAGSGPGHWPAHIGPASNMTIVLRAGPGLDILNSVCGPGLGRVCTTAAGPGRAWASHRIYGPGLGLNFRPVQGPSSL